MQTRSTIAYGFILLLSTTWCSAILLAPYWANKHVQASVWIYLFFSNICHQEPERCLFLLGRPWAVCARCASIYFGFLLGVMIYPLLRDLRKRSFPAKWLLLVALTPVTVDFSLGLVHIWPNTMLSRIITGFVLGVILSFYIIPGVFAFVDLLVDRVPIAVKLQSIKLESEN